MKSVVVMVLMMMMSWTVFASSSDSQQQLPFIVAHKKVGLTKLKSGSEKVSVSIDIYNQGSACLGMVRINYINRMILAGSVILGAENCQFRRTAYDVMLTDDSWPSDAFEVVSGKTSTSWERLDAGSIVAHSFTLESKVKGLFHGSPAIIKFRIPTKAALQEAYSTPILPLDILADRPAEKKFEWRLLVKYGSLVSVISIVVLFVYLVATPSKSGAAKTSKKRR
ncbi:hypothetical protein IFM89_032209 [Coptis chinensis]|uniref:Translocon-associated protein subunit beta n=1 Tax=Coptis chinensis TaxID=261450 RepID=A0A835I112_9MAGN|nr:hypothetical protein IFM89_032209 [Coptis chinensis]